MAKFLLENDLVSFKDKRDISSDISPKRSICDLPRSIYERHNNTAESEGIGKILPGWSWGIKMKIFIGSLSYNATEGDLRHAFEAFGQVTSTSIVKDQESGQSKGFGFVEMPEQSEAQSAIAGLNGQAFKGRTITVNEARPPPDGRRGRDRGGRGDRRGRGRY